MPNKIIDLGARLQAAFGYVSANISKELQHAGFTKELQSADVFVRDTKTSFENLTIKQSFLLQFKFGYAGFINQQEKFFAPPPMLTFRKRKRIEVTNVDGAGDGNDVNKAGEVVENYGHESWNITIQGLLIDMDNHNYPSEKVKELIGMFESDAPWIVESQLFQDHQINTIYFTEVESAGIQGFEDTWSFTLQARSIKPVEFAFAKQL